MYHPFSFVYDSINKRDVAKFKGAKTVDMVIAALKKSFTNTPANPIITIEQLPEQQPLDIILRIQGAFANYPTVGIESKLVYLSKRKTIKMSRKAIEKKKYYCQKNYLEGWTIAITRHEKGPNNLWDVWAKKGFKNFPIDRMQPLNTFLYNWCKDKDLLDEFIWIDTLSLKGSG